MKRPVRLFVLFMLVVPVLFYPLNQQASAQDLTEITILDIDDSQFPNIEITFRAVNSSGKVPINLSTNDIEVYEAGQPVSEIEVVRGDVTPNHIYFVLDQGVYSNFPTYEDATLQHSILRLLEGGYFRDGIDTAAIFIRENGSQGTNSQGTPVPGSPSNDKSRGVLTPSKSAAIFEDVTLGLDFASSTGATRALLGVEYALAGILNRVDPKETSTAIILMSSLIQSPPAQQALDEAGELGFKAFGQGTPVYSFHAHSTGQYPAPLRALAKGSGGEYLLLSTDAANNENAINRIYEGILAQGQTYKATYRSAMNETGSHDVVVVPGGELPDTQRGDTYEIELKSPEVSITSPDDNATVDVDISEFEDSAGLRKRIYDAEPLLIQAVVSWPDDLPRIIKKAEFFVDGESALTLTNLEPGDDLEFPFDAGNMTASKAVPISVIVTDELGLASAEESVTVNVDVPIVTPIPPTPTAGPPIKQTVEVELTRIVDFCDEYPDDEACIVEETVNWGTRILVVALAIALAAVTFYYRRQVSSLAGGAGRAIRSGVDSAIVTVLGGGGPSGKEVLARLHVINARRDLVDGEIKIYNQITTIGRDPKVCDITLYDIDDVSTVSRSHCTILYDRGAFTITDDNSAAGTEINGSQIPPNEPIRLKDKDEIVLGDLFRRGAKMRFEIGDLPEDDDPSSPAGGTTTSGTIGESEEDPGKTIYDDLGLDDPSPPQSGGIADEGDDWMEALE